MFGEMVLCFLLIPPTTRHFFFFFLCPLDQSLAAWAAEQLTREEVTGIHLQKCCGRFRASHSFLPYPAWYLDLSIHIY